MLSRKKPGSPVRDRSRDLASWKATFRNANLKPSTTSKIWAMMPWREVMYRRKLKWGQCRSCGRLKQSNHLGEPLHCSCHLLLSCGLPSCNAWSCGTWHSHHHSALAHGTCQRAKRVVDRVVYPAPWRWIIVSRFSISSKAKYWQRISAQCCAHLLHSFPPTLRDGLHQQKAFSSDNLTLSS